MQSNDFNQGVSFKVYPQAHTRSDGLNAIYLRIIIDRKKKEINLKVYWPAIFFDIVQQIAKPRHSKDKEQDAINLIINEAKGRANRIKLRYFSENKHLTLDQFAKEFENYESRDNFLLYWSNKISENLLKGDIAQATAMRQLTNLGRFKEFTKQDSCFNMGELTPELISKYKLWLTRKKKPNADTDEKIKPNTVINALKALQTYVNHAIADGFKIDDPFVKTRLRYQQGTRSVLDREEIRRLMTLMNIADKTDTYREVLRKFLFSCFTGIRISDTSHISRQMITGNILEFRMIKVDKPIQIPLPNYAMELIKGRQGLLFKPISDPKCNQWLKLIGEDAGINKKLTFHVSRDTFATLFIEMGGDVFTLKDLLGHADIKTTMIYVKMSENRKGILMNNFNNL